MKFVRSQKFWYRAFLPKCVFLDENFEVFCWGVGGGALFGWARTGTYHLEGLCGLGDGLEKVHHVMDQEKIY